MDPCGTPSPYSVFLDEYEDAEAMPAAQVVITFRGDVVAFEHVAAGRTFVVGEADDADFVCTGERWALVSPKEVVPGRWSRGEVTFDVRAVAPARNLARHAGIDRRFWKFNGIAGVLLGTLLMLGSSTRRAPIYSHRRTVSPTPAMAATVMSGDRWAATRGRYSASSAKA
jgi:hypothetical protein